MLMREVEKYFKERVETFLPDEGFLLGNPDREISGILVCWMATKEAIVERS